MEKNNEGMRYPSVDQLLKKFDSKYKIALIAGQLADTFKQNDLSIKDAKCVSKVGLVLEEIIKGNVNATF
ncbi:MAG: DNA-directed RNA polymerase subunit omega [Acholeplasmatales bacterium]|jgi:DNA-directed RNA polymerase subunit omega|nr:DNA-directed RNA polymerase subunit omega [Acholeplasmatales bacterium]